MSWGRYKAVIAEFDVLLEHSNALDQALAGRTPPDQNLSYVGEIYVKLLAHCVTLRSIAPDAERKREKELWDLGSLSAIARCVIETYDALSYIAARNLQDQEKAFRVLLWELHDKNRRMSMLQFIGTYDDRFLSMSAAEQQLHEKVLVHPYFAHISKGVQKKIVNRNPPESYLSIRQLCAASGVNYDYYTAATMQLSQYVHTHPFAVHQLFSFRGGSNDALELMGLPIH